MKVMTIIGTRPDLIKMSRIIPVLDECFDHIFVHTGQNHDYGLYDVFFNEMGIRRPDYNLQAATTWNAKEHNRTIPIICIIMERIDTLMEKEQPDAVLFYGDTNSVMAAYPAKRRKIPIFHLEAGNRCFDPRVPEETNRTIIDHLADVNMCTSEHARRYLLAEGLPPDRTFKIGSPMVEVLHNYDKDIRHSEILHTLGLIPQNYFVVSLHREDNVNNYSNLTQLLNALNAIVSKYDKKIVFSCHPRTQKVLEDVDKRFIALDQRIEILPPLGFFDYVHLQKEAKCVVSDSGTITEESSILGFPAIAIRQAHERPEGTDAGTVIMAGVAANEILNAIDITLKQDEYSTPQFINDYDAPQISWKIAKIIQSYTDYVNRVVWREYV